MSIGIHLKSRLLAGGVGMVLAAAGCSLMEPRSERYEPPVAGTTYENARRDTGSYGSSSVRIPSRYLGEISWQGERVHAFESSEQTFHGTVGDRFAFIRAVKGDSPLVTWNPPAGWELPLVVGKKWKRQYTMTLHTAARAIAVEDAQEIEAFEDVTVPAGTYKAWRVRTVDNQGNENLHWYAPALGIFIKQSLRRTSRHPAGPGTREIELAAYKRGG